MEMKNKNILLNVMRAYNKFVVLFFEFNIALLFSTIYIACYLEFIKSNNSLSGSIDTVYLTFQSFFTTTIQIFFPMLLLLLLLLIHLKMNDLLLYQKQSKDETIGSILIMFLSEMFHFIKYEPVKTGYLIQLYPMFLNIIFILTNRELYFMFDIGDSIREIYKILKDGSEPKQSIYAPMLMGEGYNADEKHIKVVMPDNNILAMKRTEVGNKVVGSGIKSLENKTNPTSTPQVALNNSKASVSNPNLKDSLSQPIIDSKKELVIPDLFVIKKITEFESTRTLLKHVTNMQVAYSENDVNKFVDSFYLFNNQFNSVIMDLNIKDSNVINKIEAVCNCYTQCAELLDSYNKKLGYSNNKIIAICSSFCFNVSRLHCNLTKATDIVSYYNQLGKDTGFFDVYLEFYKNNLQIWVEHLIEMNWHFRKNGFVIGGSEILSEEFKQKYPGLTIIYTTHVVIAEVSSQDKSINISNLTSQAKTSLSRTDSVDNVKIINGGKKGKDQHIYGKPTKISSTEINTKYDYEDELKKEKSHNSVMIENDIVRYSNTYANLLKNLPNMDWEAMEKLFKGSCINEKETDDDKEKE